MVQQPVEKNVGENSDYCINASEQIDLEQVSLRIISQCSFLLELDSYKILDVLNFM